MKFQALTLSTLLKSDPSKVFFCEFCKVFKKIYFVEYMRTAASELVRY